MARSENNVPLTTRRVSEAASAKTQQKRKSSLTLRVSEMGRMEHFFPNEPYNVRL